MLMKQAQYRWHDPSTPRSDIAEVSWTSNLPRFGPSCVTPQNQAAGYLARTKHQAAKPGAVQHGEAARWEIDDAGGADAKLQKHIANV